MFPATWYSCRSTLMSVKPSEGGMTGTQSSCDLNACCKFTTVGEGRWLLG